MSYRERLKLFNRLSEQIMAQSQLSYGRDSFDCCVLDTGTVLCTRYTRQSVSNSSMFVCMSYSLLTALIAVNFEQAESIKMFACWT